MLETVNQHLPVMIKAEKKKKNLINKENIRKLRNNARGRYI